MLRGDVNSIEIGEYSNIQDGTVIHVRSDELGGGRPNATVIGDYVTVGHAALIHAATLHDYSFVGMQAVVMDFAVIESFARDPARNSSVLFPRPKKKRKPYENRVVGLAAGTPALRSQTQAMVGAGALVPASAPPANARVCYERERERKKERNGAHFWGARKSGDSLANA